MGIPAKQGRSTRCIVPGVVVTVALTALAGCDTKTNKGTISASAFSAAQLASDGIRALTSRLDLLRAIFPGLCDAELESQQAEAIPFGRIGDDLGVFETRHGAVCTVDLCASCSAGGRSSVRMHFNRIGLEEELDAAGAVLPVIDDTVPAIKLSNGWVVAYERQSRSVIAVRDQEGYRVMADPTAPVDENGPNFGRGNGLIISLVLSGPDMQRELQTDSAPPRITRMHELSDGKILLFFQENFREVHVLNVSVREENVDFDLSDEDDDPSSYRLTPMLRGTLLSAGAPAGRRPVPFLTFDDILDVTQGFVLDIDAFQPVRIPSDGSALVYDRDQSVFLRFFENPNGTGSVVLAANSGAIGGAVVSPTGPYDMTYSWLHPSTSEVLILEDRTDTILAYNYLNPNPGRNLRPVVDSVNLVSFRRDPLREQGGGFGGGPQLDPRLKPAENDLGGVGQRLLFDAGRDELISAAYSNGVVVIVARRDQFSLATGQALVDLRYMEGFGSSPLGGQSIRAWDTESTSLLEVLVNFTILPDVAN